MSRIALTAAIVVGLSGCSGLSGPNDIPIGGVREPITRDNLAAARDGMPGGVLEPGWLPEGFVLIHADYLEAGGKIQSVDLVYQGADQYLHIWQTQMTVADLGANDPLALGESVAGLDWKVNPLPAAQAGRPGVVEFSRRLDDGRTATIDSDLDDASMRHVLQSLVLRAEGDSG